MARNGALAKYSEREVQRCINDAWNRADPRPVEIQERQEQPYDAPAIDLDRAPSDSPSEWFTKMPDSWRSAWLNYNPSAICTVELFVEAVATGHIDPAYFSRRDLLAANVALGFGIKTATLYKAVAELNGELFSIADTKVDALKNTVSGSENNSARGRKQTYYARRPYVEVKATLLCPALTDMGFYWSCALILRLLTSHSFS
jgi:hypothetical protein